MNPGTSYFEVAVYEFCCIDPTNVAGTLSKYVRIISPECNEIINEKGNAEGLIWVVPMDSAIGNHVKYWKQETMEDATEINQLIHQFHLNFTNEYGEVLKFSAPYYLSIRIYKQ